MGILSRALGAFRRKASREAAPALYRRQVGAGSFDDIMAARQPFMRPEEDYLAALSPPEWSPQRFYHASNADIQGPFRASRHPSLPEPTALSVTPSASLAQQYGDAIYPVQVRGAIGDAERFMARARELMAQGMSAAEASAQTQREFMGIGYRGVRWGDREVAVFDPENDVRSAIGGRG